MALQIDFIDETNLMTTETLTLIENLIQYAATIEQIENESELSISFVSNESIQDINKNYRDKDMPTDVISFALEETTDEEIKIKGIDMPRVLGDIIISVDKAKEQAEEYGHSFQRECGFLTVHGFLHLLGYDHMDEQEETIMIQKQNEILVGYGLER